MSFHLFSRLSSCQRQGWTKKVQGFTLTQVIVTVTITGVLSAIAAPNILRLGNNPLKDTMSRMEANIKLTRVSAMASTTAHRIRPLGNNEFIVERHRSGVGTAVSSCADAALELDGGNPVWQKVHSFNQGEDLKFDGGVLLSAVSVNGGSLADVTNWRLCFDSRGMSQSNLVLTLSEASTASTRRLEVFPGGSIRLF
jgi:Tfp pilus assembly protein PilE